jgi:hypothetical protein
VKASIAEKVQYGDTITAKVEIRYDGAGTAGRPNLRKWHSKGKTSFQVIEGTEEFVYSEMDEGISDEYIANMEKALGKKVGQKFTVVNVGGDGNTYTRYTITKISRPKVTKTIIAKAYKKFLTSRTDEGVAAYVSINSLKKIQFALIDINHDGYKELFITENEGDHAKIFAYLGGKVTCIDGSTHYGYIYYENVNLVVNSVMHRRTDISNYKQYQYGHMKTVAESYGEMDGDSIYYKYTYTIKGKKTTRKKFNAYIKSLQKGNKIADINQYANTAKNRNQYIK